MKPPSMGTRRAPSGRKPLTDAELDSLSPDDLLRIKLSDEEKSRLREINAARDEDRRQRVARLHLEERPIVAELRHAGVLIDSVADLVGRRERYAAAIPILLKHVRKEYSDPLKSTLARALAVPEPEVRHAWPILLHEYRSAARESVSRREARSTMRQAAQGLACALAVAVSDETLGDLIELVRDEQYGDSRILLLSGLKKSTDPRATGALEAAAADPVLHKEIASWRHATLSRKRRS